MKVILHQDWQQKHESLASGDERAMHTFLSSKSCLRTRMSLYLDGLEGVQCNESMEACFPYSHKPSTNRVTQIASNRGDNLQEIDRLTRRKLWLKDRYRMTQELWNYRNAIIRLKNMC